MKRLALTVSAILPLISLCQPILIRTGTILTSAALIGMQPQKANAEDANYYYDLGRKLMKQGDNNGAIKLFSKAIEIKPNSNYYFYRGIAWYNVRIYNEAISNYTKTIELNPKNQYAYYNRGLSYVYMGEPELWIKALSDFDKAIKIDNKYANAYYMAAETGEKLGRKSTLWCKDMLTAKRLGQRKAIKWVEKDLIIKRC